MAERSTCNTWRQHKEIIDLPPTSSDVVAELIGQLGYKLRLDRRGKLWLISLKGDRARRDFDLLASRSRLQDKVRGRPSRYIYVDSLNARLLEIL